MDILNTVIALLGLQVGVKAWVYNGEVLPTKGNKEGSDK